MPNLGTWLVSHVVSAHLWCTCCGIFLSQVLLPYNFKKNSDTVGHLSIVAITWLPIYIECWEYAYESLKISVDSWVSSGSLSHRLVFILLFGFSNTMYILPKFSHYNGKNWWVSNYLGVGGPLLNFLSKTCTLLYLLHINILHEIGKCLDQVVAAPTFLCY